MSVDLIGWCRESVQVVTSSLPDKLAGSRCAVDEDEAVVLILVNESYWRKRGFLMILFMFGLSW